MIASDSEPGHENRLQILDDLTSEVTNKKEGENLFVIPERRFALQFAIEIAQPNDLILFT
jgi:UDP-N-acetylmuramyl tripeptide synthase